MQRNLAQSLIEHGQVRTTLPKAKNLRPFVEKLVTLAVRVRRAAAERDPAKSLRARRQIHKLLAERSLIPKEHHEDYWSMSDAARKKTLRTPSGRRHRTGEPKGRLKFTGESVTHRLIEKVAAKVEDRSGGYTRIVRLPDRRIGDNAPLALVQLVGDEEAPTSLTKPAPSARKRRADARYKLAIKLAKTKGTRASAPEAKAAKEEGEAEGGTEANDA
jgi:large subunit ribosomal protein L17